MVQKRLSGEKKFNIDVLKLKFGSINKNDPHVIYVSAAGFISPLVEMDDYSKPIRKMELALRKYVAQSIKLNTLLNKTYILDFDVRTNGLKVGKKSFCSFECHFTQTNEHNFIEMFDFIRVEFNKFIPMFIENVKEMGFELQNNKISPTHQDI